MQLIYSLMLVSAVQQGNLVIYINIYSLFTFYSFQFYTHKHSFAYKSELQIKEFFSTFPILYGLFFNNNTPYPLITPLYT